MNPTAKRKASLIFVEVASLVLVGLFWAGCATRSYSGPVHGLTFNGTVQSVDLQHHRFALVPLKPSPPIVFDYETTTQFWRNDIPIHADEVESGRSVRVHYHAASGQPVAHHVYIQLPYARQH